MVKSELNHFSYTLPSCILIYSNIYIILCNEHPSSFCIVIALNEEFWGRWVYPHFIEEIETYRVNCLVHGSKAS